MRMSLGRVTSEPLFWLTSRQSTWTFLSAGLSVDASSTRKSRTLLNVSPDALVPLAGSGVVRASASEAESSESPSVESALARCQRNHTTPASTHAITTSATAALALRCSPPRGTSGLL